MDASLGVYTLSVVEKNSFEIRLRGCVFVSYLVPRTRTCYISGGTTAVPGIPVLYVV